MKKYFLLLLILIFFSGCQNLQISEFSPVGQQIDNQAIKINNIEDSPTPTNEEKPKTDNDEKQKEEMIDLLPANILLAVPFADQAPYKNWGEPYQEACEEASIIMANEFAAGNEDIDLDKDYINKLILDMVSWQESNWGGHFDLDAKMTLDLFQKYFNNVRGEVVSINSTDDLKKILSQGKIIIAPTYGRNLANPYFTPPGPVYHMLVIKGYDEKDFITNDPGIWQGKDFVYSWQNLYDSIYDLPAEAAGKKGYIKANPELMYKGAKNVIIILKPNQEF